MATIMIGGPTYPDTISDEDMAKVKAQLSKAKIQLMAKKDSAFFTTLAFSLRYYFDLKVPTACTNGAWVKINPYFWLELDVEEQIFLILHEALHVAYLHMMRLMGRCPDRWNKACDYVINLQLVQRGFKMPACGLLEQAYDLLSSEEVYKLLEDNPGQPNSMPDLEPGDTLSPDQVKEITREVEDILVRAQIQSQQAGDKPGSIPGEIEIFLNKLLNPKLPWQRIVQKYLQNYAKNDYSFQRPNRRYFPKYHLPSLYSRNLIDLVIAIDVSGSITQEDFLHFVTEIHALLRMMKPKKMTLIQFDTRLTHVDEITDVMDLMRVKFHGGGGTEIGPVIDWANANKPQLLMVFTDGEFNKKDCFTKVDTLWIVHDDPDWTAPFGKVVHYELPTH